MISEILLKFFITFRFCLIVKIGSKQQAGIWRLSKVSAHRSGWLGNFHLGITWPYAKTKDKLWQKSQYFNTVRTFLNFLQLNSVFFLHTYTHMATLKFMCSNIGTMNIMYWVALLLLAYVCGFCLTFFNVCFYAFVSI
jgi:hypothetical protein